MPRLEPREHRINLAEAAAHTRRHRIALGGTAEPGDHAGAFHADQVLSLLAQKGCAALRIYHGRDEKGGKNLVLVGVDEQGKDMVGTGNVILEEILPCPPWCDDTSALNR